MLRAKVWPASNPAMKRVFSAHRDKADPIPAAFDAGVRTAPFLRRRFPLLDAPRPRHTGQCLLRGFDDPLQLVLGNPVTSEQCIERGIAKEIIQRRLFPRFLHSALILSD